MSNYTSSANLENSLRTRKYDDSFENDIFLACGYIEAAEIIFKEIRENDFLIKDNLVYPLLNLYYCSVESSLKTLLKKLRHHHCCCKFLNDINDEEINLCLQSHKISGILRQIGNLIPKRDSPHSFNNFSFIEEIVKHLDEAGINSYSARYHCDKKNKPYQLFTENMNVNIEKLHEDLVNLSKSIYYYVLGDSFYLCEVGHYTNDYLRELEFTLAVVIEHKDSLNYSDNIVEESGASTRPCCYTPQMITIDDLEKMAEKYQAKSDKLKNLQNVEHKNLSALVMAIYIQNIGFPPTPNLERWMSYSRDELLRTLQEKNYRVDEIITTLDKEIKEIKKYV